MTLKSHNISISFWDKLNNKGLVYGLGIFKGHPNQCQEETKAERFKAGHKVEYHGINPADGWGEEVDEQGLPVLREVILP